MNIVFLGSGNLATHLSVALAKAGHDIIEVYSPTLAHAEEMAQKYDARALCRLEDVRKRTDVFITAVKDDAQELVWQKMKSIGIGTGNSVVLHTSGSLGLADISKYFENCGVFYPLQSFSKDRAVDLSDTPFLLDPSNEGVYAIMSVLAGDVTSNVVRTTTEERKIIHLAAVFASNFSNYMYDIAHTMLAEKGIPFSVMLPLIRETAEKVFKMPPKDAQTGPARRKDEKIIGEQMQRLGGDRAKLYELMSKMIIERHYSE